MARCYEVSAQAEQVRDGGVDVDEAFRLEHGPKPSHSRRVPLLLKQHVDDFPVLVDGPPESMIHLEAGD